MTAAELNQKSESCIKFLSEIGYGKIEEWQIIGFEQLSLRHHEIILMARIGSIAKEFSFVIKDADIIQFELYVKNQNHTRILS